jgi:hypothetical protein
MRGERPNDWRLTEIGLLKLGLKEIEQEGRK